MTAAPASPVPTISPAEMQILISRSGLVLNPGQMADLVLAWRQVAGLIAAIPQGRPLADDLAFGSRLSPVVATSLPPKSAAKTAKPGSLTVVKSVPRSKAKSKPKAVSSRASGRR
jgi:hypothetical protein